MTETRKSDDIRKFEGVEELNSVTRPTTEDGTMQEGSGTTDALADSEDGGGDEERDALRRECDGLFGECRRRAGVAERAEERKERDLATWRRKGGMGPGAIGPVHITRPPLPLPLRDGLYTPLARMLRRMDTPQGRLMLPVRVAEATVLPRLAADGPGDKAMVSAMIGYALRLDEAVSSGLLVAYVVCWRQNGRWPRRPSSIRLLWPGGKAEGDRILGEHGPTLDDLIARLTEKKWTHWLNGRPLADPPLPGPPIR